MSTLLLSPSEKGFTLKGKNCSQEEIICMKCQILFSGKNEGFISKTYFNYQYLTYR